MKRISFEVLGRPVPQGSMTASYNRKTNTSHVHHVQGAALAQWRASLRLAAKDAGAEIWEGPVQIIVIFGVYKAAYPKRTHPVIPPDLDKLVRALLDALTGVCYTDDKQVISLYAGKVFGAKTEVVVREWIPAKGKHVAPPQLEHSEIEDIGAGQLSMSSMWETWGE